MAHLTETFRTPEARVQRTIVAVDLTDSTAMKTDQGEAGWLSTYGWFFDLLGQSIVRSGGNIVKYLGDGIMAVFPDDHAAEAINWSILIQEEMALARAKNLVRCSCSVGIAFGELVEFDSPMGGKDYIGTVADRAFRLCGVANANAIFVDTETVAAASMTKISAKAGRSTASRRSAKEYQGNEEAVEVKGFAKPVAYFEILWENARFSVKPEVASELSRPPERPPERPPTLFKPTSPARPSWLRGRVSSLGPRFGFITGLDEEQFWFNPDCHFNADLHISFGSEVWFIPADPIGESKNRRATEVLPFGTNLHGVLQRVFPEGFGFGSFVSASDGNYQIFVNLGDASDWTVGDMLSVTVGANAKGIAGFDALRAAEPS